MSGVAMDLLGEDASQESELSSSSDEGEEEVEQSNSRGKASMGTSRANGSASTKVAPPVAEAEAEAEENEGGRSRRAAAGRASLVWQSLGGRKSATTSSTDVDRDEGQSSRKIKADEQRPKGRLPKQDKEGGVKERKVTEMVDEVVIKRGRGRPRKDGRPPIQRKIGEGSVTNTAVASTNGVPASSSSKHQQSGRKAIPRRKEIVVEIESVRGPSASTSKRPLSSSSSASLAAAVASSARKRPRNSEEYEHEKKQDLKPSSSGRIRKAPALDPVVLIVKSSPTASGTTTSPQPSSSHTKSASNRDADLSSRVKQDSSAVTPSDRVKSNGKYETSSPTPKSDRIETVVTPKRYKGKEIEKTTPKRKSVPQSTKPSAKRIFGASIKSKEAPDSPSMRLDGTVSASKPSLIKPTSSDAYFVAHAARSRGKRASQMTSDHVLSDTFAPIPTRTISALKKHIHSLVRAEKEDNDDKSNAEIALHNRTHFRPLYDRWTSMMLQTNRPLLFHGLGSKREHLEDYVTHLASEGVGASVIVRGEGGARIDDIVREMERNLGETDANNDDEGYNRSLFASALEARTMRIVARMSKRAARLPPRLFILVHNLSTPSLLQPRAMRILSMLQSSPAIHILASIAHVQAGHLGGLSTSISEHDAAFDKALEGNSGDGEPSSSQAMNWLWIDMTTFVPSLEEILTQRTTTQGSTSTSSASRIAGLPRVLNLQSSGLDLGASNTSMVARELPNGTRAVNGGSDGAHELSDRAALHILRSVTYKARALFLLLADRLLSSSSATTTTAAAAATTMSYAQLAELARRNFLAGTPDMMRVLLVEFTSHGLVRVMDRGHGHSQSQTQSQGADEDGIVLGQGLADVSDSSVVSIALDPRALRRVVDEIKPKL